jgi:RHS repeat-associated protein
LLQCQLIEPGVGALAGDVVSSAGSALDHVVYDSFGNILTETNASDGDRFKSAGMQYDAATGQYYDHARDYNSATGCFTGQNPRRFAAGDTNLYRYVKNEPTIAVDPNGEMEQGNPNSNAPGGMSAPESDQSELEKAQSELAQAEAQLARNVAERIALELAQSLLVQSQKTNSKGSWLDYESYLWALALWQAQQQINQKIAANR